MMVILPIPVAWFTDDHSESACIRMNVRVIKAKEWINTDFVFLPILPTDFSLSTYIQEDKLHAIYFKHESHETLRIHPDAVLRFGKRELAKRIKRVGIFNVRRRS